RRREGDHVRLARGRLGARRRLRARTRRRHLVLRGRRVGGGRRGRRRLLAADGHLRLVVVAARGLRRGGLVLAVLLGSGVFALGLLLRFAFAIALLGHWFSAPSVGG